MTSTGSSLVDLMEFACPDQAERRKRRRRRNKHVNPTTQRNVVKPPPPPPRCTFRQPSLIDPDGWVVLVRCADEEALHDFDEKLPLIAPKAGVRDAVLRSHGFMRLVYVLEEEDTKARSLAQLLRAYSAVFVGRTHKPFVRERTLEVHGLPDGIGYSEVTDALDCQFPGKSLCFDVLVSEDPRRDPEREVLIVTHDPAMCSQLLNNGGLKLFDERLAFRCSERSPAAAAAAGKWKRKKAVPEAERQCFRCLAFGHMAESCDMPPRCKRCGGPHAYRECSGDAVQETCVNCGAVGHRAVSRCCPMRPGSSQKRRKDAVAAAAAAAAASAGEGSPASPSPSDSGADDSLGLGNGGGGSSSCPEQAERKEGGEEGPPSEPVLPESPSEDDAEYFAAEASTEEPRDSSAMASPALTVSPDDDSAEPDFTPGGVSSTTGEPKKEEHKVSESAESFATAEKGDVETKDETKLEETNADATPETDEDDIEKKETDPVEAHGTTDESEDDAEKRGAGEEDVLFFTASVAEGEGDVQPSKTASAVASFFSDLFGAADAPSKPLDDRFVATLRSLQESVYADIVARHPRRGASSPRERKPAKKRRLLGPAGAVNREAHSRTAGAAASRSAGSSPVAKSLGSPLGRLRAAALADGAHKASRGLAERRLRVLEQFLRVVNAILEIE